MWSGSGEGNDYDILVNSDGKRVAYPVGSWDCSPLRPDSHGIHVAPSNADLISAAPDLLDVLKDLVVLVRGEAPSLLNEDSGGDANLSLRIDAALAKAEPTK